MAQVIKSVVIAGAGGDLGPHVLQALLDAKFDVSVLSRSDSTSTFPATVKVIKTDYSEDSLVDALKGQDAVVSLIGNGPALNLQKTIINAAVKVGVKRFIPNEFADDTENKKAVDAVPHWDVKAEILEQLRTIAASNPEFTWTGIAPGTFFDWGLQNGFLGFDLKNQTAEIWDDGDAKFSVTNLATVGRTVAEVLNHSAETANKYIYVHSFLTSQNEILASLEKYTGKSWTKTHIATEVRRAEAAEAFKKGDFMTAFVTSIRVVVFGREYGEGFGTKENFFNSVLGLPEENLDASVKALVQ